MNKIVKYEDDNNLDLSFEVSGVSLKLLKKKTRKREKKKEVAQHLGQILSASVGFIAVPRDFHFRDDSSRGLSCQDNVLFFTAVLSLDGRPLLHLLARDENEES